MDLKIYGWNEQFEKEFGQVGNADWTCGRVFEEHKQLYRIHTVK